MAMTKTQRQKLIRRSCDIREALDLSTAKVDRANAVIRGVKILGRSSTNRHGMPGVSGTDYTREALEGARHLYEGVKVNYDHPPRNDPDAERRSSDRGGKLLNVQVRSDGLYGDLHLIPSHSMTPNILDAAERLELNDCFALSHNAKGYGDVREGRYRIKEIPLVRSVDIVADGGTNRGLFESREKPMKKTLIEILEAACPSVQAKFKPLLEADDEYAFGETPMNEPAPEAEDEPAGWEAHLGEMVKAIIADETLSLDEKAKKIAHAVKLLQDEEEGKEGEAAGGTEITEEDEEGDKKAENEDKLESRERQELENLRTEKKVRNLCESLQFTPTPIQLKALIGLQSDVDRKAFIKSESVSGGTKTKSAPKTGGIRNLTESASSKPSEGGYKSFLESIRK